jgi:hypothetical protein
MPPSGAIFCVALIWVLEVNYFYSKKLLLLLYLKAAISSANCF